MSQDSEWCDNCGAPLETAAAASNDASPSPSAPAKAWLEPGDTLTIKCDLEHLSEEGEFGKGRALLELELLDLLESSSVRHICRARVQRVIELDGEVEPSVLEVKLKNHFFSVEELGALLGTRGEVLPEVLAPLVRVPVGESEHGEHLIRLFREDGSATLEEFLFNAQGQLEYTQIKQIFGALLDLVEHLHARGYLYLRLSPWTLRVLTNHPMLDPEKLRHEGEITEVEDEELPSDTDVASPEALGLDFKEEEKPEEDAEDDVSIDIGSEQPEAARDGSVTETEGAGDESDEDTANESEEDRQDPSLADALSGTDAFEDEDEDDDLADEADDAEDADKPEQKDPTSALHEALDHLHEPLVEDTSPGFPRLDYDADSISEPFVQAIERALLDGGFRFYRAGKDYQEVPVVVGFSPPEMFGRSRAEIGTHCDIFSLGMLLYFLISGELPPTSIYTRHIPAIPSRHFRPDFPIGLQTIISRATRPSPSERYSDVASMRDSFERACELIEQRLEAMQQHVPPRIDQAVERHIGIAKRLRNPTNQDNVFGAKSPDHRFSLLVVADGVSTASFGSGDLASKQLTDVAIERWPAILDMYLNNDPDLDEFQIIYELMREANQRIIDHVNLHHFPFKGTPHEVMGTTALVAIINHGIVTLGSLGDSRAYLQRGTSFEQITIDHNLWTLSILEGASADNALSLPHGDALARCLGTFIVEDHKLDALHPQPDIFRFPIMSGDTLLMTTDGLIDFGGANTLASEDNILSLMLAENNPALACLEMILLANRGGGGDNIGIALAKFT